MRHDLCIREGYSLHVITFRPCFVSQRFCTPYQCSRPYGALSGNDSYPVLLPLRAQTLGWELHLIRRIFSCFSFGNCAVRAGGLCLTSTGHDTATAEVSFAFPLQPVNNNSVESDGLYAAQAQVLCPQLASCQL